MHATMPLQSDSAGHDHGRRRAEPCIRTKCVTYMGEVYASPSGVSLDGWTVASTGNSEKPPSFSVNKSSQSICTSSALLFDKLRCTRTCQADVETKLLCFYQQHRWLHSRRQVPLRLWRRPGRDLNICIFRSRTLPECPCQATRAGAWTKPTSMKHSGTER